MKTSYRWYSINDISGGVTLIFDNLTCMATIIFLLTVVFGMPASIVLGHIIPGLSVGIVVGNLAYIYLAFSLAKRLDRDDITAFPLGLDAPSCIGLTLSVVGPSFVYFKLQGMTPDVAALHSWYISCACCFFIGLVKFICSFFIDKLKNFLPPVALLGGLSGVAIALIAFFPLLSMFQSPMIGILVFSIIAIVFFCGYQIPANLPAVLVAIIVGTFAYYILEFFISGHLNIPSLPSLKFVLPLPDFTFISYIPESLKYLSIALPFALLVIFGTVSVAESSEVLGEKYNAKHLLMIDGIATMLIGLFGGTAQTTAHAGFPAYKKMNARAGFLILNTLIVGIGAWFGLINFILAFIPDIALSPVLLFIGIEIALQVFLISEKKYLPAVIFGLFPSIARMVQIKLSSDPKLVDLNSLNNALNVITNGKMSDIAAIVTLGNGFIVTGTLWIALLYYLIERKIIPAVATCLFLALATIFGAIHSVHLDGSMYWIGDLAPQLRIIPIEIASGYLGFAVIAVIFYFLNKCKSANLH
ncbi:MAG: hypothetical protein RLZZ293_1051 [Pseudomonadota bacterium]|jgi:AGZA family xanthine/uracil permease-like MFS transporter